MLTGQIELGLRSADAGVELAQEHSFAFWNVFGSMYQGAFRAKMGKTQQDIASLRQGLATIVGMGNLIGRTQHLSCLVEAHLVGGQAKDGLTVLAEMMAHMKDTGERYCEPELYRLNGDLLLMPGGGEEEAEACFKQAFETARRQSAKSLELRAAMSLARLWQKQGRTKEAHRLLAGIYGWFTECFDTPDLVDARALLEELS